MSLPGVFTVDEAREVLAGLLPVLARVVEVRADVRELGEGFGGPLGGLPELKAAQATLDDLLTQVQATGVELKGIAPLLLDFPADLHGVPVLLCWLEGEPALGWYHRADLGFAGRRPLPVGPGA